MRADEGPCRSIRWNRSTAPTCRGEHVLLEVPLVVGADGVHHAGLAAVASARLDGIAATTAAVGVQVAEALGLVVVCALVCKDLKIRKQEWRLLARQDTTQWSLS